MALDPVWLIKAKQLANGQRTRIECCARDTSMLVSNGQRGYSAYCFRCGEKHFQPHGEFSIEMLRRRKEELALIQQRQIILPRDFTTDIPPAEAVWLYRAGVGVDMQKHYGFGYSAYLSRVILPIYSNGKLDGFTARSTINARPKYIEKVVDPAKTVFIADWRTALASSASWAATAGPTLVFTEDILSAVRVGRNVRHAVSLLGTSASAEQVAAGLRAIEQVEKETVRIAVWLDGDKPGQAGAMKIVRTLKLQGYEVRNIITPKDPKRYTNREIREVLSD